MRWGIAAGLLPIVSCPSTQPPLLCLWKPLLTLLATSLSITLASASIVWCRAGDSVGAVSLLSFLPHRSPRPGVPAGLPSRVKICRA